MSTPEFQTIAPDELANVLARAHAERWSALALIFWSGPFSEYRASNAIAQGRPAEQVFFLREELGAEGAVALAGLPNLTSLDLGNNGIGDEGAEALAGLTNLTSLDLGNNGIGDEGAEALAGLTNLTSLDLGNNGIGAEGAEALAGLPNLTSLDLGDNGIGAEGAVALAGLPNLTSLALGFNGIGDEGAVALAGLTNLTSLNLWGNGIGAEGAVALAGLTNLTSLNLRYNGIGDEGAVALAGLTNLTSLDLRSNDIGDEGAVALAGLTNLTSLDLGANGIGAEGAVALAGLTNLTSLALGANGIGAEGAVALAGLTNLTSLDLGDNGIGAEGAVALAGLTNLTSLALGDNGIGSEGAVALAGLPNLTSLNLVGNGIGAEGAVALAGLTNLTSLALHRNRIGADGAAAVLDAWVEGPMAARRRFLDLRENEDLSELLPAEVLKSTNAQAILAAYRRYRAAATAATLTPLAEAKLLVVGNEAVGKTSLIRYLVHGQARDPDEKKTPGIAHEKIETQAWAPAAPADANPDGSNVTLNVWDFGGQEIMHGTHRFFLTARSLYLLVLEARREDDDSITDWLKTIRNRGDDSPIIVVVNKCDDEGAGLQLDETGLRNAYPGIVGFVQTSCDDNDRPRALIAALRRLIVTTLADDDRLKHVRDQIPAPWQRIKEAIAAQARAEKVLSLRAFERLCEAGAGDAAITDQAEQRALLGLLHDLGVVVACGLERDRAALRDVTLLDPNWLTGAIYTLLNHRVVADQGGEFARGQLGALLDPGDYPADRHEFILEMMEDPEVGLTFELPGSGHERYLIPEALPKNQPDYGNWPKDSLRFRFSYDLLLPGLIPRFIVQAHRNLTDNPTRWRTGVVLGAAGCQILVQGDRDRRRLDFLVDGPVGQRRSALNIALNDLEAVHKRNPEIGAKALVPLPDQPELAVSYQHLLNLEETFGLDYQFMPEDAGKLYRVADLLEGVRRERVFEHDEARRPTIRAGDHAQITVVEGDLRSERGDVQVGQQAGAPSSGSSWQAALASWRFFSLACGAFAVVGVLALWLLPSGYWRVVLGSALTLGLVVTVWVQSMNPATFYRRTIAWVAFGGMLALTGGVTLDLFVTTDWLTGWLRSDGPGPWVCAAWVAVIGFLVWGDINQSRAAAQA